MLQILLLFLAALPAHAYYGRHSTEAILTFEGWADVKLEPAPLVELNTPGTRVRRVALERIDEQVRHLMGSFQANSFRERFGYPGALGERYQILFTGSEPGSAAGRSHLRYKFRGEVVFQKDAFHGRDSRNVLVTLPIAPDLIYALGVVRGKNRCTDRVFNSAEDFWYYWDPDRPGCPLEEDQTHLLRIRGQLFRLPNTTLTYPEYHRLYGDNGNGTALDIAVLLGYIRYQNVNLPRPNRRDEALRAFRQIDEELRERGFEVTDRKSLFRVLSSGTEVKGVNYLRKYRARVNAKGQDLEVRVLMLLADSDIDSEDVTFRHYLLPALLKADVLVYDGHSNLGRNLDLNKLPDARFDKRKYQIYFFNGCSTYPYLNGSYFRAKGGTSNVDIVTAGLPSFALSSAPNVLAFIDPFLRARAISYQRLLSELERSNGDKGTYLVGVKGDEDNEWTPN